MDSMRDRSIGTVGDVASRQVVPPGHPHGALSIEPPEMPGMDPPATPAVELPNSPPVEPPDTPQISR